MDGLIEELERRNLSLLIYKDGEAIYSSHEGGVIPLLRAVELLGLERLHGSIVADKVVGKAAALLILYFKASEAHALLISSHARGVFLKHGLKHSFRKETPYILNRDGSALCPFERLVMEIIEPEEAYRRIREHLSQPHHP